MSAILLLAALAAPEPPPIIVTARVQTAKALADCLARKCGVREDAIASIQHAQAQFADGQYPEARKTLLASLNRNRRATGEDPRALSALWHALARVTLHNGDLVEYRKASLRAGSIMARATSVTESERIRGEVQVADALASAGDPDGAVRRYRSVAAQARSRGDDELSQMLELRAIYARSSFDGKPEARRKLERAAGDPSLTPRARAAAASLAAQLQEEGSSKTAALLESVPVQPEDAPTQLIFAPKDALTHQREAINHAVANNDTVLFNILQPHAADHFRYSWADVGFWIRPDGRVADAEILRGSNEQRWAKEVLRVVQGRRYSPFQAEPGSEGRYKIERATLTFEQTTPVGSFIRRRAGLPSLRFEELKVEDANGGERQ